VGHRRRLQQLQQDLLSLLVPRDAADEASAIVEVRAGTGGGEAALFARELTRMYERYATLKGWRYELMNVSQEETAQGFRVSTVMGIPDALARADGMRWANGGRRGRRRPRRPCRGAVCLGGSSTKVGRTACSACPSPRPMAACTRPPPPSPSCHSRPRWVCA
jgi:peptide chain release factor 1